ncbi:hypothetical protein OV450_5294 [Actinobacteria bacterium OV450]|nr:hypothetical protein OV450_5294 [Actinobacteria bacterium OV450]
MVNGLGPDAGSKRSRAQRDAGAKVVEERFSVVGIRRRVRRTRVRAASSVHGGGERGFAFAALVDHGRGDPDLGRGGGDRQSCFQVFEEGTSAVGGEAGRPGRRRPSGPEFFGRVASPRERRIILAPVTDFAGAVEEDLRRKARGAAIGRSLRYSARSVMPMAPTASGSVPARSNVRAVSLRAAVNTCRTSRPALGAVAGRSYPLRNRSTSVDRFRAGRASGMTAATGVRCPDVSGQASNRIVLNRK